MIYEQTYIDSIEKYICLYQKIEKDHTSLVFVKFEGAVYYFALFNRFFGRN